MNRFAPFHKRAVLVVDVFHDSFDPRDERNAIDCPCLPGCLKIGRYVLA